jgi:tetratricopeptide (TPR) repeat protein
MRCFLVARGLRSNKVYKCIHPSFRHPEQREGSRSRFFTSLRFVQNDRWKIGAVGTSLLLSCLSTGCRSEILEKQAEQLRQQEMELTRQRKEIDDLLVGQKLQEQKARDCNLAFREYFEKAQMSTDREQAIALYRKGLAICPDDDVAHYELGKALTEQGSHAEAEREFEAALKINPNFSDAKKQLDAVRKHR